MFDAHVHIGYWKEGGELKYYSPRRIAGVLERCGVQEFIVSSTSPQAGAINVADLIREAEEMKRVSCGHAHIYCWLTGAMYEADPQLTILENKIYEGVKLHEGETSWNGERRDCLKRILDKASECKLNVMFHCGARGDCMPNALAWTAKSYPELKFNFAHCRPTTQAIEIMRKYHNVYTDISCLNADDVKLVTSWDVAERIMYGSDFPAIRSCSELTKSYRDRLATIAGLCMTNKLDAAFLKFIKN